MTLGVHGLRARGWRVAGVPTNPLLSRKSTNDDQGLFALMTRLLWSVLCAVSLAVAAAAQTAEQPQQKMAESVSVGYVMIPFTALDPKGRAIVDLHRDEVALRVD